MAIGYSDADVASLRDRLQRSEDEAAIRNVIARFAQSGDDKQFDTYIDQFAEDATFEIVGRLKHEGIAQIGEGARERMANPARQRHVVTGTLVEVDGDAARARSYWMLVARGDGAPRVAFTGTYEDRFVRTPRGWKYKY